MFHVVKDDGREVLTINILSKYPAAVRSRVFGLIMCLVGGVLITSPITYLIGCGLYGAITGR